jgi:hypothetical protein
LFRKRYQAIISGLIEELDEKMANGWMPEGLDKEGVLNTEGSPHHFLPDTSTLTDRKTKRSWQMPLAKYGGGYSRPGNSGGSWESHSKRQIGMADTF